MEWGEPIEQRLSLWEIRETMRRHLKVGNEYTLQIRVDVSSHNRHRRTVQKKFTCIGIYQNYALFQGEDGKRESFLHQDLYKAIVGKGVIEC